MTDGWHAGCEKKRGVKDDSIALGLCVWVKKLFLGNESSGEESTVWFKRSIRYPGRDT